MIKKYTYGTPFPTESVTEQFAASEGMPEFGDIHLQEGFSFTYKLRDEDVVYGLGEANRGINKRGYQYISNNSDNPHHHEDVYSLYAAHNFIIVSGEQTFGLYFDYPSTLTFDVGYTRSDELHIFCESVCYYRRKTIRYYKAVSEDDWQKLYCTEIRVWLRAEPLGI